jgi:hypothetical protein
MNKCTWCGLTPDPYTYLGNQWPSVHQVDAADGTRPKLCPKCIDIYIESRLAFARATPVAGA